MIVKNYKKAYFLAKASVATLEKAETLQEVEDREYVNDQPDLLKIDAILVSTGMNDNDDVFVPSELLPARNTAKHKPLNKEHNDYQIIGHMTNSYVVTNKGERIPESNIINDVSSVPANFHIASESVMYAAIFPDEARKIRERAQAGELFVSVEAWYTDYDYLVGNKIVARNQDTAGYLEPLLRENGGDGLMDGQKVGRVLRDIIIAGIGLVKAPANKNSVIKSVSSDRTDLNGSIKISLNKLIEDNTKSLLEDDCPKLEVAMARDKKIQASASDDADNPDKKVEEKAKKDGNDTKAETTGEAEKGANESKQDAKMSKDTKKKEKDQNEGKEASKDEVKDDKGADSNTGDQDSNVSDDANEETTDDKNSELNDQLTELKETVTKLQQQLSERDEKIGSFETRMEEFRNALDEARGNGAEENGDSSESNQEDSNAGNEQDNSGETDDSSVNKNEVEDSENSNDNATEDEGSKETDDSDQQTDNDDSGQDDVDEYEDDLIDINMDGIEELLQDALDNAKKDKDTVKFTSNDDGENDLYNEFAEVFKEMDIGLTADKED
jgi:hypothetical protein